MRNPVEMLVLLTMCIVMTASQDTPENGYYHSRYDHLNVDAIVNSRRLVQHYAACLLDKGPCPPQGAELKRILPEALETNCRRCTEKQKIGALRTIRRLRKEYPKVWEEVAKLWDPTGEYIERFESTTISKKDQERSPAPTTTTVPIFNRFDDAINNDIVPEVSQASSSTPRVASTTTTRVVTQRSSSTTRKSTTTLRSTSSTKSFTTTRTERGSSSEMPTTTPSDGFPKPTLKNIFNVRVPENGKLPILYQIKIPVISVASEKIIDSLSNISNKVVKVGTFATKMLFSTIHAIVGKHAENKA